MDEVSVYWADYRDGSVAKVPIEGGAATTLATGQANPAFVAVDTTNVYWSNSPTAKDAGAKTIGGVEDEYGFQWSATTSGNHVTGHFFPRLYGTYDKGFLLPIEHSSLWLRSAAGKSSSCLQFVNDRHCSTGRANARPLSGHDWLIAGSTSPQIQARSRSGS